MSAARPASPLPRGAEERARRPQLRVVDQPRHSARYLALLAFVAVLGVTGVVSLNALAAEASFKARELDEEVTELSRRYDELTVEVAELQAPERVRRIAVQELGMVEPEDRAFLGPDGQGGQEGQARPARPANGRGTTEADDPATADTDEVNSVR